MKLDGTDTEIGTVKFESDGNTQFIRAHLHSLSPGKHGFHIHEKGVTGNSCGAESTGGHYKPGGMITTHGALGLPSDSRHIGDFGNVKAGQRGDVNFGVDITVDPFGQAGFAKLAKRKPKCSLFCSERSKNRGLCTRLPDCYQPMIERYQYIVHTPRFELEGEESVVGRAVVLHAGEDDLGQGGDEGSLKTGNAGTRVACCTLHLNQRGHVFGNRVGHGQ